jgi:hypothetical protein
VADDAGSVTALAGGPGGGALAASNLCGAFAGC